MLMHYNAVLHVHFTKMAILDKAVLVPCEAVPQFIAFSFLQTSAGSFRNMREYRLCWKNECWDELTKHRVLVSLPCVPQRALCSSDQHLLIISGLRDIHLALTSARTFSALALASWNIFQTEIRGLQACYRVLEEFSTRPLTEILDV